MDGIEPSQNAIAIARLPEEDPYYYDQIPPNFAGGYEASCQEVKEKSKRFLSSKKLDSSKGTTEEEGKEEKDKVDTVKINDEFDVEASTPPTTDEYDKDNHMLKTSSWINTFYLITTDILGPQNAPYSISSLGYVPGILLYLIFGVVAMYTGLILNRLYLDLDTPEKPIRTYSDIAYAVFTYYGRHTSNSMKSLIAVFQVIQQCFAVALLILGNAQGLQQIIAPQTTTLCFLVLSAGFTVVGCFLGQIKSFRNLAILASWCIYLNLFICVMSVIVASLTPPLTGDPMGASNLTSPGGLVSQGYVAVGGPVQSEAVAGYVWTVGVSGIMNMTYAYAGANMFVEFMNEMKNPREFWKSQLCAQIIIMFCYMLYGALMYYYQGQYVANPGNQGLSIYSWQTVGNVMNLFTGMVAAAMYGNVGLKVIYITIAHEMFGAPSLSTRFGSMLWSVLAVSFWIFAWIISESIPQFSTLTSICSAAFVLQFTYTFPPMFQLAWELQQDKTWYDVFHRRIWIKCLDILIFTCSLSLMGIGLYSSVTAMISSVAAGTSVPFSCSQ